LPQLPQVPAGTSEVQSGASAKQEAEGEKAGPAVRTVQAKRSGTKRGYRGGRKQARPSAVRAKPDQGFQPFTLSMGTNTGTRSA
jgi:hypothetical protein